MFVLKQANEKKLYKLIRCVSSFRTIYTKKFDVIIFKKGRKFRVFPKFNTKFEGH